MSDLLIDISRPLSRTLEGRLNTGVDRVCLAYIRHYRDEARAAVFFLNCLWIFPQSVSKRLFDLILLPQQNLAFKLLLLVLGWGATTWFPQNLQNATLLNLGHSNLERKTYLRSIQRRRLQLVCLVHDLIPLTHPEYCRQEQQTIHAERINNALTLSSALIANSRETLAELETYSASNLLPLPPAAPALIAADPLPAPSPDRPMREPYFVLVGTIEPRKNYAFLLQLWREIALQRGPAHTPHLVLIGQRGWECENIIDLLERCPSLRGLVREINTCSDREMATLLHHAQALLFPSFSEGFGLPIAEALAAGVPVIASDLPVFREFAGTIPEYLSPLDGAQWQKTILEYASPSSPSRAAQIARLSSFAPPTWDAHFQAVHSLLEPLRKNAPARAHAHSRDAHARSRDARAELEDAEPAQTAPQ